MSGDVIVVASRSKAVADLVAACINQINPGYDIRYATNDTEITNELRSTVGTVLKLVFMEASFYYRATTIKVLELVTQYSKLKIIIFGLDDYDPCFIRRFFQCGIEGYINFREGIQIFKESIKEALLGHYIIPAEYTNVLDSELFEFRSRLSDREIQIIMLILQEFDNNKIAAALGIKPQSVKNRRKMIYEKLHVNNIVGLIKLVLIKGLVDIKEFLNY